MALSIIQHAFADQMVKSSIASGHLYPTYAAAETCLESAWGSSRLSIEGRNVFGLKAPKGWTGETLSIPTKEFIKEKWVVVDAIWPVFETYTYAFTERMLVLRRNPVLYQVALDAKTGEEFITEVSKHWSTDPERGQKVLSIYKAHPEIFDVRPDQQHNPTGN